MRVSNSTLAHSFCNELNFNYKTGNFNFKKSYNNDNIINLYSYNTIIAIRDLKKGILIISNKYYSVTTSKHRSLVRNASNNSIIDIYDINESNMNNLNYLLNDVFNIIVKDIRAYKSDYKYSIEAHINNLKKFLNYFKIDKRGKLYKKAITYINMFKEATLHDFISKELNIKMVNKKALYKKNKVKFLKEYNSFSFDRLENYFFNYSYNNKLFLDYYKIYNRLLNNAKIYNIAFYEILKSYKSLIRCSTTEGNVLITNQNIKISFDDAKKLYYAIIYKKIKIGDTVLNYYKALKITDDYITIGCHTFNINHLKKVYNLYLGGL